MTDSIQPRDRFLGELRKKTSDYHNKLEETALSKVIMSEQVTLESYIDYLTAMYIFTKPFEETYFPLVENTFTNLPERRRTELLKADLLKLGWLPSELESLDFVSFTDGISKEEAVGAMYVMEGSSLGGRVIFKHIHKTLGLSEDTGASYFFGHGTGTGKSWTTFLDELWQFAGAHDQEKICDGAVKTFRDMYTLFSGQEKYAI